MQRAKALAGVEWSAVDMTFDQDGRDAAIKNRTQLWAGSSGVFAAGVVATVSGLTVSVSGPLKFQCLGELGLITTPGNLTAAASQTNYVIAKYGTTDDTPAPYYAGGSPPNIHTNETPTVLIRTSGAAVEASGEVNLATVVTGVATVTNITDTRVILPTVSAGNIALGAGNTVDGMDPSAHVVLAATSSVLGHVKFGIGGAAAYGTVGGDWWQESFIDLASALGNTYVLDASDFSTPPGGATPVALQYWPTRYGDFFQSIYAVHLCSRLTFKFASTTTSTVFLTLVTWDDTVRVRANGTQLYSASTPGTNQALSFSPVVGNNTVEIYWGNVGGGQGHLSVILQVLAQAGMSFNG